LFNELTLLDQESAVGAIRTCFLKDVLLIWQSTIADAHQLLLPAGRQSLGVAEEIHGLPGG
jgi:hypothetical protein